MNISACEMSAPVALRHGERLRRHRRTAGPPGLSRASTSRRLGVSSEKAHRSLAWMTGKSPATTEWAVVDD